MKLILHLTNGLHIMLPLSFLLPVISGLLESQKVQQVGRANNSHKDSIKPCLCLDEMRWYITFQDRTLYTEHEFNWKLAGTLGKA